jgi:hypothetical protein
MMVLSSIMTSNNNMRHDTGAELGFPYCPLVKRHKTLCFARTVYLHILYYSQNGRLLFFHKQHQQVCLHIGGLVCLLRGRN